MTELVTGYLLRKRPFPGSASLWILLDESGVRQEVLERGSAFGRRVQLLDMITLAVASGRSRYRIIRGLENRDTGAYATAPGWFAFTAWLAELLELGIMPDDPHPDFFHLLGQLPLGEPFPPLDLWGQVVDVVLSGYGVWVSPQHCRCQAVSGRGLRGYCPECESQAEGKLLTKCGRYRVSVAQLLIEVDSAIAQAFDYSMKTSVLARELGLRGILQN